MDNLNVCVEKFTNGRNNFEKLLGAQKYAFDKQGLRSNYTSSSSNFWKFQNHFVKATPSSMPYIYIYCTYCSKNGYKANKYFVKRKVESGRKTT